eukprot:CAMPEP_0182512704 /NCGR_PEP_ID=MMETSP1321-20130603/32618_1 /TAXON_ID=91990 /ORGANISM="Bolidomonas sp., Strain RCC1657" /LENGTH=36 /DNA_ID= /DNA_START= /DNA_END= /DNA_ORIENTATION=
MANATSSTSWDLDSSSADSVSLVLAVLIILSFSAII